VCICAIRAAINKQLHACINTVQHEHTTTKPNETSARRGQLLPDARYRVLLGAVDLFVFLADGGPQIYKEEERERKRKREREKER
jgi:hypothetical protein